MTEALRPQTVLLAYWLVMIVIAAFLLRMACSICRTGMPSWRRSFVSVLFVTLFAYLAFDFTAYLLMRTLDGVRIHVPSWYGYNIWFREPFAFKWLIISQLGIFRFLPFVLALFVATLMQFVILQAQVTFGFGLLIVVLQWGATFVAGYILSLLFGVVLTNMGWTMQAASIARPPDQGKAQARQEGGPEAKAAGKRPPRKGKTAKADLDAKAAQGVKSAPAESQHDEPTTLELARQEVDQVAKNPREYMQTAGENLKAYAQSHVEELSEELAPLTRRLPEPVQNFLDKGGWWIVLGVLGFIALLWLRAILRALGGAFRKPARKKKRRKKGAPSIAREKLAWIAGGFTERGPRQLTVKGLPARLRLIILAPGSGGASELSGEMADRILDWIKPGMAEVASHDQAGVRVWPPFYSTDGFANAMAAHVPLPEPKGMKSRWVLLAGHVKIGRETIRVGMAMHADEPNSLRLITIKGERWLGTLGMEKTPELAVSK